MCQHYEHSAAESTIDLDSPPHGCRVPGGNLLLLRCDKRNEVPTSPKETNQYLPEAGKAEPLSPAPGTGRSAPTGAAALPAPFSPATRTVDNRQNFKPPLDLS